MKALWLLTVPLLAFSLFVVVKTRPATACTAGCSPVVAGLGGQYCTDKTGGQVFVADGAPTPDGVRCGAAAASPSPSASPSASPAAGSAASGTGTTALAGGINNPMAGTMVEQSITTRGPTVYPFPAATITLNGQYCQDKTGGVVFVPSGSPKPAGVTC